MYVIIVLLIVYFNIFCIEFIYNCLELFVKIKSMIMMNHMIAMQGCVYLNFYKLNHIIIQAYLGKKKKYDFKYVKYAKYTKYFINKK